MLKRTYARISIVLFTSGAAFFFISILFSFHLLPSAVSLLLGAFATYAAFTVRDLMLKCPSCSRCSSTPQWSKNGTFHCFKCGSRFVYDR